jgi:hypothetical protein
MEAQPSYLNRMPRKPKPTPDDPEQSKRFIEMAREVEVDEGAAGRKAFEQAFEKVTRSKPTGETADGQRQVGQRHKRGKA